MTEWQQPLEAQPSRIKWFIMLAEAMEQIESAYIMDQIDRPEYEKQMSDLDAKLGIIGLALSNRPKTRL